MKWAVLLQMEDEDLIIYTVLRRYLSFKTVAKDPDDHQFQADR
jgi:hypothetical protein